MKRTQTAWLLLLISVVLTAIPSQLAAESKVIQLRWEELSPIISGQEVQFVLPDGTLLRGDVFAVEADSLANNVKKTSDKANHPKGPTSVPRASISSLDLTKTTIHGRVIGTTVGVGAGALLGTATLFAMCYERSCNSGAATAATLGVGVGVSLLGHFLGRSADMHVTTIKIVR